MESVNPICKQFDESLDAFHDGELDASEKAAVEAHVKECERCAARVTQIGSLVSALKTLPRIDVPVSMSSKLDNLIDQQTKVVPMRRRMVGVAAAAAMAALVGAGAYVMNTQAPAPSVVAHMDKPAVTEVAKAPEPVVVEHKAPAIASNHSQVKEQKPVIAANTPAAKNTAPSVKKPVAPTPPMIASASVGSPQNMPESMASSEEIAELPTVSNSFNDAIGVATNEDGLYDIQM